MATALETKVDQLAIRHLQESQEDGMVGHELDHLGNVAKLTKLVAVAGKYSPRETALARIPAWGHDFVRSPAEGIDDALASADHITGWLIELNKKGDLRTTTKERDAIYFTIRHHGIPPRIFNGKSVDLSSLDLKGKLHVALFAADKGDANGPQVVARRSMFVAGKRLNEGDLKEYGFNATTEHRKGDEELVVLLEGFIRMGFVNPQYIYPPQLDSVIGSLYDDQRAFQVGLMKSIGISVTRSAAILLGVDTKYKVNLLGKRGDVRFPENPFELADLIRFRTRIGDEMVSEASDDLALSARESVMYFSSNYKNGKLAELNDRWAPQGNMARKWRRGIREWNDGTWFDKALEQIKG